MAGHGEAEVKKFVRTCMVVFSTLMVLTVVTVAISYLHLPTPAAITVGLIVATVKASLVALFFMHLISERHAIYYLLGLTAGFFALLMYLPSGWYRDEMRIQSLWTVVPAPVEVGRNGPVGGGHGGAANGHGGEHAGEHTKDSESTAH
jgi:cytochrome c oxidase subunit 4